MSDPVHAREARTQNVSRARLGVVRRWVSRPYAISIHRAAAKKPSRKPGFRRQQLAELEPC